MKAFAITAILLLACPISAPACGPEQFEVTGLHSRAVSGYAIITGQVKNNCTEAAAVWLMATVYGKDGEVLAKTHSLSPYQMSRRCRFSSADVAD